MNYNKTSLNQEEVVQSNESQTVTLGRKKERKERSHVARLEIRLEEGGDQIRI